MGIGNVLVITRVIMLWDRRPVSRLVSLPLFPLISFAVYCEAIVGWIRYQHIVAGSYDDFNPNSAGTYVIL